jgi:hypothetical protein
MNSGGPEVAGGGKNISGRNRLERRYVQDAASHMEGETPQVIFRGNTFMSIWLLLLLLVPLNIVIVLLYLFIARHRAVIVTDRQIHIFQPKGLVGGKSMSNEVATLSRPAEVELTRWGLKLGDEKKIYAIIGTSESMKQAAALAQQPPT